MGAAVAETSDDRQGVPLVRETRLDKGIALAGWGCLPILYVVHGHHPLAAILGAFVVMAVLTWRIVLFEIRKRRALAQLRKNWATWKDYPWP
jgi:EamA domain-containing membrane protein RarD